MSGDRVQLTAPHSAHKSIQTPNTASPVSSSAPVFRLPTALVAADDSTASVGAGNAASDDTQATSHVVTDRQPAAIAGKKLLSLLDHQKVLLQTSQWP